jgi:SAM-dependent methyltransferase
MQAPPASGPVRLPHAALDVGGRLPKAEKIVRLLGLQPAGRPLRVLEVGTGSGVIAQYIAGRGEGAFEVDAVDVIDQRTVHDGYRFTPVHGTTLPFPDAHFDAVISNHVIEHVGDRADQAAHLRELGRVLRADGVGYLAVPSRWQVVEPHYRLAFLSWLPRRWRSAYVRARGKGRCYDCEPLRLPELEALFVRNGLHFENLFASALAVMLHAEPAPGPMLRCAASLPMRWLDALRWASPTHIYRFGKPGPAIRDDA